MIGCPWDCLALHHSVGDGPMRYRLCDAEELETFFTTSFFTTSGHSQVPNLHEVQSAVTRIQK